MGILFFYLYFLELNVLIVFLFAYRLHLEVLLFNAFVFYYVSYDKIIISLLYCYNIS